MTPHTPDSPGTPPPALDPLERRLAALTDWREGEPTIYAEALARAREGSGSAPPGPWPRMRLRPKTAVVLGAAAVIALGAAAQLWVGNVGDRNTDESPPLAPGLASPAWQRGAPPDEERKAEYGRYRSDGKGETAEHKATEPSSAAERSVIRKATIELECKDVKGAFAKCSLLINEATGEFVEGSSLTGEGPTAQGTLTIRVAVDRLSDVLNRLRELGTVASEKSTGDDVTDQAVDLAARLRNERRVESELLGLLETRKGAPLKEILDLREQLAKVRGGIEQMTAQQERIEKSVALATVLVILRPEPVADGASEAAKHEASALEYFGARLDAGWHAGTRALADSAAGFVRAAVGGLVWWVLVGAAFAGVTRVVREARRRAGREPAPAL
jgi:hypothetical protein